MASGIYAIENTETGMIYVGQAMDIEKRWKEHASQLKHKKHPNPKLQVAWDQCGQSAFKFLVLEICPLDTMTQREQHYLDTYLPLGNCYNVRRNAITPASGWKKSHRKPAPKPDDYIDPNDLDDVEKMIVKAHRLGGNIRVAFLMAALSETDDEFNEYVQDIQKYLARKVI